MLPIYLYIKTHRKTGLKYLGKTTQDPFKYEGSGTYWKNHLKKHGNDVETYVIGAFSSKKIVTIAGRYHSAWLDIVESNEWTNLIPVTCFE